MPIKGLDELDQIGVSIEDAMNLKPAHPVMKVLERFFSKLIEDLQDELKKRGHIASYELYQSINVDITHSSEGIKFSLEYAAHGEDLEEGMPSGTPIRDLMQPIAKWVRHKLESGQMTAGVISEENLTYLISRHLSSEGREPSAWFSSTINDGRLDRLEEEIMKEITPE